MKLTKGQLRKLNALKKSIGDKLGKEAFAKWLKENAKVKAAPPSDPVVAKIQKALASLARDKSIKLENSGYTIKRARGRGSKGFVVEKIVK